MLVLFAPHQSLACAVASCVLAMALPPAPLQVTPPVSGAPVAQDAPAQSQPGTPPTADAQAAVPPATPPDTQMLDPNSPLAPMADIGVAWPDLAADDPGPADATTHTNITELSRYTYRIEGIEDVADDLLNARFEALSTLRAHDGEPANAAQIDRRAREDATLLTSLLRTLGYYDARVSTSVAPKDGVPQVTLTADAGQLYTLQTVDIDGLAAAGDKTDMFRADLNLNVSDPVNADKIVAGEDALRLAIPRAGFPFASVGASEVVVDHATKTATLTLDVTPGALRRFGQIVTPPNRVFDARHIQDIARFKPGELYDSALLEDLRRAVVQTGLVSAIEAKPVEGQQPGTVDIAVKMDPAPMRTIAGEIGYGTGEGFRAEVSWTHRNLFPPEGALTLRGVLGTQEQSGGVIFRRNNFNGRDRVLTAQVNGSNVTRAAYQATTASISGSLERQTTIFFQKAWTWSLGAEIAASDERDVIVSTGAPRRRTFFIASLPTSLTYDGSDDLLNPTKGFRIGGRLSPEVSLQGSAFVYARVQFDASAYQSISSRLILAERIRFGTIVGAPRDAIAPSRRFYAGGGASVRGYGYQAIGPRDPNNDPIGGRSLTELSVEARIRVFGNFGIVPFLDAGNIYTDPLPGFTGLQYGAGIGLRYYSNFGPIRLDVGTPLNPKPGDPRVAVYVSLGQAF